MERRVRVIDCPHCQRRLRFPDAESGQSAVYPGCGDRFVIAHEDGAWVSRFPGETDSIEEAIQAATPAVSAGETTLPEEEPKELAPSVVTDKQSFFVDGEGRRSRIIKVTFQITSVASLIVGFLLIVFVGDAGKVAQAFFGVLLVSLMIGCMSAIVAAILVSPNEWERDTPGHTIEERREKRRDRKRKRRQKASKRQKGDDGPSDMA